MPTVAERQITVSALNGHFDWRDELNQWFKRRLQRRLLQSGKSVFEVTVRGERRVFWCCAVALSLCSGVVLVQVVVGQTLVNFSPVFSAHLQSGTRRL